MVLTVISATIGACGRGGDTVSVPRQKAYPRISLPNSVYRLVDNLPLRLEVNAEANVEVAKRDDDGVWVDVNYPSTNASLHFTFTKTNPQGIFNIIDNRLERVILNTGGNDAEMITFRSPSGFDNQIYVTRGSVVTPVQFISTDEREWVVSGMSYLPEANEATADSLAPVVAMLRRDVTHALKNLGK